MARKKNSRGFMHIKKRTEGTSNELSFSVLDAKSNDAAQNDSSPRTVSELGKISVFTMPSKQQTGDVSAPSSSGFGMSNRQRKNATRAISGAATLGASPEVVQRKQRRRSWHLLNIAAVLALLGILIVVGSNIFNSAVQRHQGGEVALVEGISLLEQSDEALVALDKAVAAPASEDQTILNQILSDIAAASSLLDRATTSAEAAAVQDESDAVKEGSSIIKEAASARKALIEQGKLILSENAAAKSATNFIERCWEATLEADNLSREGASLAEQGPAHYSEASEASMKAMERFQDALVLLRQAKVAYPQANYTNLETYLEMRSAAQQNAVTINAASGEQAIIDANSAAYNEAEEQAAALAAKLPENPAQPIIDRYAQEGGKLDQAYQEARTRASRADAEVRSLKERHT